MHQFLLDYKNSINRIQTDNNELKSYAGTLFNQMVKKRDEAYNLKNDICSIIITKVTLFTSQI
ncbi:CRASP family complement regulator-acquiring lipoprotein [Borreliella andersonii]|uniref:CRASP family complement regulator-acquiring lipoprotein n=1 Tax=Borrelia andersonii TaxID=42109 RepID=UPI003BA3C33E